LTLDITIVDMEADLNVYTGMATEKQAENGGDAACCAPSGDGTKCCLTASNGTVGKALASGISNDESGLAARSTDSNLIEGIKQADIDLNEWAGAYQNLNDMCNMLTCTGSFKIFAVKV
jgi:hypothetical protein